MKEKIFTTVVSIVTVFLSAVLSLIISHRTVSQTAVAESQRESFLKEIPVMNKVFEISEECEWGLFSFIEVQGIREIRVLTYMYPDNTVMKQDTTYSLKYERDTTDYRAPLFIYKMNSYEIVQSDLQYIEGHMDELSLNTYKKVRKLLDYVKEHPILFIENEEDIPNSEWTKLGVFMTFRKIVIDITRSYRYQLEKYGLGE